MAQLASASGLGPEGPVFESQYPDSRGKLKRFSSFFIFLSPAAFSPSASPWVLLAFVFGTVLCPPLLQGFFVFRFCLGLLLLALAPVFSINLIIGLRNGNGRGEESPPKLPTAARRSWRAA